MTRIKPWHQVAFLFLWTLFVLYPNPYRLAVSITRIFNPPVEADAVRDMAAAQMDSDPRDIELFVLSEFPYQYDWLTYNVPWYFPTVSEALAQGTGDCKTRFVVLASVFEALEIPYQETVSLTHFWLTYEDKEETSIERSEYAWLTRDEEGTQLQMPGERFRDVWDAFREAFWDYMPSSRKVLFSMGPILALGIGLGRRSPPTGDPGTKTAESSEIPGPGT